MMSRRSVHVDDETWQAVSDHAADTGQNVSAVVRTALRTYLRRKGYGFTTSLRAYARRGTGRGGNAS